MAGTVTLHTDQLTLTTPTVSLYPDGSDTAAETGTSATEATNRKGTYTFSNTAATGLHLIILISSATQRWYGWAVLATSGNIVAYDTRAEAIRMQATASTGVQDVNATQLGGDAQSLTDLKDFADAGYDPATNKVEGVKLVDMTTTNSDMRGTDNALTTLGSNAPAGWINEAAFANDAITDAKVASDVTINDVTTKTGYKLASDGLDSISTTAPSGVAANFREMMVQLWRRFYKKATMTSSETKTFADDGTTVLTTQAVSDNGTTQEIGAAT